MRIRSDIAGISAFSLNRTSQAISRALERLSSGRRVSSPSDDQAAYSLDLHLDSQVRGIRTSLKGIQLTQQAIENTSSAIQEQLDIVQRMREIALEASSSSIESSRRANLESELKSLLSAYQRIDQSGLTTSNPVGNSTITGSVSSTEATAVFKEMIGTGRYQSRRTFSMGAGVSDAKFADVNGDGNLDLIAMENTSDLVSIQLGNGTGTFGPKQTMARTISTGAQTQIGDFNNDGLDDILAAYGDLQLDLSSGDGTFRIASTVALPALYFGHVVGDFNNDGNLDFVMAVSNGVTNYYLGDGTGAFSLSSSFSVGTSVTPTDVGDINGDGRLDYIARNQGGSGIQIMLNDGAGSFSLAGTVSVTTPLSANLGDLNRDGKLDLVVARSGFVSTFTNDGAGNFTSIGNYTAGTNARGRLADINNDGLLDVVTNDVTSTTLSILMSNGDGSLANRLTVATTAGTVASILGLRDLNKDGIVDIMLQNTTEQTTSIFLGIGVADSALDRMTVATAEKAQKLISVLDATLERIESSQSQAAALHNRLDFTVASQLLLSETLEEAKARAIDVDLALETAELVRLQILQQAQVAVMAHQNLHTSLVMKLLVEMN